MSAGTESWACPKCAFELWFPVQAPILTVTRLGLYEDSRFPGRCLLVFEQHAEYMEDLLPQKLNALWSDAVKAGRAIRAVTGAERLNYAVLGNSVRHLHVHLIPRQPTDPLPTRPPWNDPR